MIRIKNLKRNKKAQAAMEFLTTYGWAILILIIIIVALANLGVFKGPQTPNSCTSSPPISCSDVSLSTGGVLTLKMAGEGTFTSSPTIAATGVTLNVGGSPHDSTAVGGTIGNSLGDVTVAGDAWNPVLVAPTAGNKFKGTAAVIYTLEGGLQRTVTINFVGTV